MHAVDHLRDSCTSICEGDQYVINDLEVDQGVKTNTKCQKSIGQQVLYGDLATILSFEPSLASQLTSARREGSGELSI